MAWARTRDDRCLVANLTPSVPRSTGSIGVAARSPGAASARRATPPARATLACAERALRMTRPRRRFSPRCAASPRQYAAVPGAAPRQAAALDDAPALDLMRFGRQAAPGQPPPAGPGRHFVANHRRPRRPMTACRLGLGYEIGSPRRPSRGCSTTGRCGARRRRKADRPRRVRVADGDIVHPNASDRFDGDRAEPHQDTAAGL